MMIIIIINRIKRQYIQPFVVDDHQKKNERNKKMSTNKRNKNNKKNAIFGLFCSLFYQWFDMRTPKKKFNFKLEPRPPPPLSTDNTI